MRTLWPFAGGAKAASSGVNGAVMTSAQTLTAGQQAQALTNIGAQKGGVQYLTANAAWDGSLMVTNDINNQTLDLAGATTPLVFFLPIALGDVTIANSPGAILDGQLTGPGTWLCWINAGATDGATTQLA